MRYGKALSVLAALTAVAIPAPACADARITGLTDVNFGTLASPVDQSSSQSLCVFSSNGGFLGGAGYSVRATGSGGGGAFVLSSGPKTLPYEVRWADSPGQAGGTQLSAGVLTTGFDNGALFQTCLFQSQGTASLTVTLRASQIAAATAGNYSGVLQITIVPE